MKYFAIIDINNFYVSCERIFRPDLENKPVVVLSNNDGCVVSRSNEVKKLGITMAAPYFKIKDELKKAGTSVFSSNYTLYGDISNRVMNILGEYGEIEIYSIDEAFLDVSHLKSSDLVEFGLELKNRLKKDLSLPVCVGFGKTKTLAKAANEIAKIDSKTEEPKFNGVVSLIDNPETDNLLENMGVGSIWGVGRKNYLKLAYKQITTAKDLKYAQKAWIKSNLSITGLKIIQELNEESVVDIHSLSDTKKGIVSSRSFGKGIKTLEELKEAVSSYITKASQKLRKQKSVTNYLSVFVRTNRFDKPNYYHNTIGLSLPQATNYTSDLVKHAHKILEKIYKEGAEYKKAGVAFWGIIDENKAFEKVDLFEDSIANENLKEKQNSITKTMDKLNKHFGENSLILASNGLKQDWKLKSQSRSPRYTTKWEELLKVG